ncbi:hypothetical protein BLNAU_11372 [Blattamonas nauphoetae]|uniref:Rap-GAP domain-containing protein n=1 Tax=Blattamonas nauphoetae TaxID=2049346 RepID=A0ABQ9XSH2_9EUKA|nr:hypothetical protein BLNAU_11372 [Blattamonas nauphoetae]
MEEQTGGSNLTSETFLSHSPESRSTIKPDVESFLTFNSNSKLSFEDKSTIYCSLVALVKAEYPFDDALQERAARFLKNLQPEHGEEKKADRRVIDLVPSPIGSPSGFMESILTLLSSPHPRVVETAMSFFNRILNCSSIDKRCYLVKSDLVAKMLATVQPHTLSIPGNETILSNLIWIILACFNLTTPPSARNLDFTTAVDTFNHREMIFQKVVITSSRFATFMIANQHMLNGNLFLSFMELLRAHVEISPYHRPTLDFVLRSRIMMTYSSSFSFVEQNDHIWCLFGHIFNLLTQWDDEGPEEVLSVKQIVNAHISEGFEDTLEQMMKHDTDYSGPSPTLSNDSNSFLRTLLGCWECHDCCASLCTSQQLSAILEPKEASKEPKCGQPSRSFAFARASGMDRTQLVQHSGNRPTILLLSVQTEQLSFPHFLPRSEVSFVVNDGRILSEREPFLTFDQNTDLSFEDKSATYSSLVNLVKAEYPFDDALQYRATLFLKSLEPKWSYYNNQANKLVTDLVPSTTGSYSGFVESIVTLVSCPHSTVVGSALSFLYQTIAAVSPAIRCHLMGSDLIPNVFTTVRPHTLPITGNETIIDNLHWIIYYCLLIASPSSLKDLGTTAAVDQFNHREMIFQRVILPSSQFVTFLISNRHVLNGNLFKCFMTLLYTLIQFGPYHRPTLEFVLASPIAMALTSCLSILEDEHRVWVTLLNIDEAFAKWKKEYPEVVQSGKWMIQALISEGFENIFEQMMKHDNDGPFGFSVVYSRHSPMTPNHLCGSSSDVGNALIAGADEQILGSPPIVQKWFAPSSLQKVPHISERHIVTRLSFPISTSGPSLKYISFISSNLDVSHIPAIPQPSPICFRTTFHMEQRFSSTIPGRFSFSQIYLLFEDKSATYCLLVALVKAEHPFDEALQEKAARFLKNLRPNWRDEPDYPDKLVIDLVPSTTGSHSGFVESIVTLVSCPHSTVVGAALSFLNQTTTRSSPAIRCHLMGSDLVANMLATVQPHTLSMSENVEMIDNLMWIIYCFLNIASPSSLKALGITAAADIYNQREMIFRKMYHPWNVASQLHVSIGQLPSTMPISSGF